MHALQHVHTQTRTDASSHTYKHTQQNWHAHICAHTHTNTRTNTHKQTKKRTQTRILSISHDFFLLITFGDNYSLSADFISCLAGNQFTHLTLDEKI